MQQFNCQAGQSWIDVCLNTYGSINYLSKLLSDNAQEINVSPKSNQSILWDDSLVVDSSIKAQLTNRNAVLSTSIFEKTYVITSFTAGTSTIDFVPDGSNGWDATFLGTPTTQQVPSGVTLVDCTYDFNFWSAGIATHIGNGSITSDTTINSGANGAGVYELIAIYNYSDGSYFGAKGLVLVNATDGILASLFMGGVIINSVNGLTVNVSSNLTQVGCSYIPNWGAFDSLGNVTFLASGITITATIPSNSVIIASEISLDALFLTDFAGDNIIQSTVSIN